MSAMTLALVAMCLSSVLAVTGDAAAPPRTFRAFEARVCQIVREQNRQAAPYILQFNNYYYNDEHTPENLRTAGHYFSKVNQVWRRYARRILAVPAPRSSARLWRRYSREEWRVLRINSRMVTALLAADNPRFEELEKRNVSLQERRDQTWERIGLYCA
jgi:hypothetical protein